MKELEKLKEENVMLKVEHQTLKIEAAKKSTKTRICWFWSQKRCTCANCTFAHGIPELR